MKKRRVLQIQDGETVIMMLGRGSEAVELELTEEQASELKPLLNDWFKWHERHRRFALPGYIVMISSGALLLIFNPQHSALKFLLIALLSLSVAYEIAMLIRYMTSPLRRKLRALENSASEV